MADLFSKLSNELMDKVLSHCSAEDLARARLVSSRFREPAGRLLFQKLTFWPTLESATSVASIIASGRLRAYVREFYFSPLTSLETMDPEMFLDSSNTLPAQVLDTLRRLSLLDNLNVLGCHHDRGPNPHWTNVNLTDKYDTFRGKVLTTLIFGLAKRGPTSRKLETLDIINLPCRSQPDLTDTPSFSALLQTLQTLLLQFDYSEANDQPYEKSPRADDSREFFTRLPRAWLAPAATALTSLALGASQHWGYILKVDFRGVRFPRLESLVLQEFVFSHDWQLEWILRHTSLQKLCLIQCRILTHARWFGGKDIEDYPTSLEEYGTLPIQDYYFGRSWCQYYQRLSNVLGSLRWFTTRPDSGSAKEDLIGLYTRFNEYFWFPVLLERGRRAEDEEALELLEATANRRSGH